MALFKGYKRSDGSVGIRNYVIILPTTACANGVAMGIAKRVPGVVALTHGHGCGRGGADLELHNRTFINLGKHPNVAAVLVIGLGCELINARQVASAIATTRKPVELIVIQQEGGSRQSTEKGVALAQRMLADANQIPRELVPLDHIILGLECGGSDAFSGVTANAAVGQVADWLVEQGGTVLLTENTEMIGTKHLLLQRACNEKVAAAVDTMIELAEKRSVEVLGEKAILAIAPGNMEGGLSSIMEKSLGCIVKGGGTAINQVVAYGEKPTAKGLVLMDAPGYDTESMTGVVAGGAQVILFTTGRGNPIGFPIIPVIKIASTSELYAAMEEDMDINAGTILEGSSLESVGQDIVDTLCRVLAGEETKAEINEQGGTLCLYTSSSAL